MAFVIGVTLVLMRAPHILIVLFGVGVAAVLTTNAIRQQEEDELEFDDPQAKLNEKKIQDALGVGQREVGFTPEEDQQNIVIRTNLGVTTIEVDYIEEVPVILLDIDLGASNEMAFIIRRKQSALRLPKLVDNTPIVTTGFEYRLRKIPLSTELGSAFDAAASRPRLFADLLENGFEQALLESRLHPSYRLEDLVYGGRHLTATLQPAADPATMPYIHTSMEFVQPVLSTLSAFLASSSIPSARS